MLDLEKTLEKVKGEYKTVMEKDVPAYNKQIESSGLAPLKTTGAPPPPPPQRGRFGGSRTGHRFLWPVNPRALIDDKSDRLSTNANHRARQRHK